MLFAEKGGTVSMDAIARQAGVSKQTLYNRYPSKIDIARALANTRSDAITAPLRAGGASETVLTALAAAMMEKVCSPSKGESLRGVALMSPSAPELAQAIYEGGPGESLRRLSAWLRDQDARGLLAIPDPDQAAEMFTGMVLGHAHLRSLLGIDHPPVAGNSARAGEVARRFLRAFAV